MDFIDTLSQLRTQWMNPSDVSAVLMIIGGDVVRTALAQSAGLWFTPVCFSLAGSPTLSRRSLASWETADFCRRQTTPLRSSTSTQATCARIKNWVIGRILRDHEASISRRTRCDEGVRISIFKACKRRYPDSWTSLRLWTLARFRPAHHAASACRRGNPYHD